MKVRSQPNEKEKKREWLGDKWNGYPIKLKKQKISWEMGDYAMKDILIRLANENDYNTIEVIMKQVQQLHIDWRPDLYKMGEDVFPYEMYMNAIQNGTFIVAEVDDKVVGFVYYEIVHIENDNQVSRDVIFIDSMGVDEQYRGNGVGHQLFDYVKKIKQEKRIDKIELQVNSKNINAREMYQKYGFKEKAVTMELE